jgi:hypothetical protein
MVHRHREPKTPAAERPMIATYARVTPAGATPARAFEGVVGRGEGLLWS